MSFFVIIIIVFIIISSKKKAGQPNQRNQQFYPPLQNQRNQQPRPQMQNQRNQQPRPQMQNPGMFQNASFSARQYPKQANAATAARPFAAQPGNMTAKNAKSRPAASYKDKVQNSSAGNGVPGPASVTASGSKRINPTSVTPSDPVPGTTESLPAPALSMEGTLYIPNEPSTLLLGMVEYDQRFGGF